VTANDSSAPYSSSRRLSDFSYISPETSPACSIDEDPNYGFWPSLTNPLVIDSPRGSADGSIFEPSSVEHKDVSKSDEESRELILASPFSGDDEEHSMVGYSHDLGTVTEVSHSDSLAPDLAMIAPCPIGSPLLEFCAPAFSEFSDRPNRRALVDHFCNVLSHLLVFREESGNPFQQLVLPLTRESSPVMNAIYALASAHMEYRGVEHKEKSLVFHNRAIQGLARLIEQNGKAKKNEILAAIMLLVYYEVVSHISHVRLLLPES